MSERSTAIDGISPPATGRDGRGGDSRWVGAGHLTRALLAEIATVAPRSATVLVEGETGVGKEVAALEIHDRSRRAAEPFVPVDCTAFSSQLIESQLFGHVKGAFTGAVGKAIGFMRCADGGTLFLDEIGELPLPAQAKLLRCVQERAVVPVGGVEAVPVDLRIIAATHRDLPQLVRCGRFRQDLYFRLNVVRLTVPPLRARPDDVLPLARHFLSDVALSYDEPVKVLSAAAEKLLMQYDWPGNVRELRNAIERAFLFCGDRTIGVEHLPAEVHDAQGGADQGGPAGQNSTADGGVPRLDDAERLLVAQALKATRGNQSEAARLLGVERHRLRRKIARHGLEHLLPGFRR